MTQMTHYQQAPEVLARDTLTGVLLLAPGASSSTLVSHPGDAVWALLQSPITVLDLSNELSRAFQAQSDVIEADVQIVLDELVAAGCAVICEPNPGDGRGR